MNVRMAGQRLVLGAGALALLMLWISVLPRRGTAYAGNQRELPLSTQLAMRPLRSLDLPARPAAAIGTSSAGPPEDANSMSSRKDDMHLPPMDWRPAPRAELATSVDAPSAALVREPLPRCSVVFFHHLEKTGGTTLRSILQRHAQLGEFDLISFVNRFDKLSLQIVLHRLHTLAEMPGTSQLDGLRLAVEIHIGGHMSHPYFNMYSLPDLLFLRSLLRAKGCRCNLVTLLRHPLLHHLSWHYHFCNHRVPLCFWRNPPDCEARLAMGLTCHDGPHLQALTPSHERAVRFMWEKFDLVGVVELFDEFVLSLSDLVGLRHPAYRMQIVASETLSRQQALQNWTSRTCASLVASPPEDLMGLIIARMRGSASNAKNHLLRNGGSSTGGPRGHMECRGYGPCVVEGVDEHQRAIDMRFDEVKCAAVSAVEVLRRACENVAIDERLYLAARREFEARGDSGSGSSGSGTSGGGGGMDGGGSGTSGRSAVAASVTRARVTKLREAGVVLAARADAQKTMPLQQLEALSGAQLRREYVQASGGGVPWSVNEREPWYLAHERARFSCVECSGDVVPEKDLLGCWPLWTQFAPDELRYRCNRSWTADPGWHDPQRYRSSTDGSPIPCWQSCWTAMGDKSSSGDAPPAKHCTASCPTKPQPAAAWRAAWDVQLAAFVRDHPEGREWRESMAFVGKPLPMETFVFNVY